MSFAAEERFYSEHFGTQVLRPSEATRENFKAGGRYFICERSLGTERAFRRFGTIVELGCGAGDRLLFLKEKYAFERGYGFDLGFSKDQILDGICFKKANLNNRWDLQDGTVDVLIAMMVLEHLFDPFFCFREISRVLCEDGRAFVNLPLVTNLKNRVRLLFGLIPITSVSYSRWEREGHWDGFHLHYFTMRSIFDLAKHAGLEVISVQGVGRLKSLKDIFPSFLCGEISFELKKKRSI